MEKKKIMFFGTPKFAAYILEALINNGYNVIGVVSQPDKEVGRKKILTFSPVKEIALKYNIPIYQPVLLRKDYDFLKNIDFDLLISAAYGQILPQEVLDMAKINCVNVHGSLLPKYRGGAPIQRAIINGDHATGITIIKMVDKMDAGVMYGKKEVTINETINSTELFDELMVVGKDLLLELLPDILENKIKGEVQNEDDVTFAWNIKRNEEKIDFSKSAKEVVNLIRGLALNPGAYCLYNSKELKIYKAAIYNDYNDDLASGTINILNKKTLLIKCSDLYIRVFELKLEGKNQMDAASFINGLKIEEVSKKVILNG